MKEKCKVFSSSPPPIIPPLPSSSRSSCCVRRTCSRFYKRFPEDALVNRQRRRSDGSAGCGEALKKERKEKGDRNVSTPSYSAAAGVGGQLAGGGHGRVRTVAPGQDIPPAPSLG